MSLLLSFNPDRDLNLAHHLKQQSIPIEDLKIGDIIVTCQTCIHITEIKREDYEGEDYIWYSDEFKNGSGQKIGGTITILDRSIINRKIIDGIIPNIENGTHHP